MSQTTSTGPTQTINFTQIPEPWLVPGSLQEIVSGFQNVGALPIPARTLIIGGMTSAGSATAGAVIPNVPRPIDARGYGGPGSHIDAMCAAYLTPDQDVPFDIVCLADAGGGAATVTTITFTGPATAAGTTAIAIAGQRISIGTLPGDTATVTATEFAAAINAGPQTANLNGTPQLPVTATSALGVVTVTARNKGACGNDISFVVNPARGDATPPGLTITVAQTTPGATNPSIGSALSLVSNTWYTDIIVAWQDSTNQGLAAAEAERRFSAMVHGDCRFHFGVTGTVSQQISTAAATNERFIYFSPMQQPGSPPWAIAASAGGICAKMLTADPARQLDDVPMPGIVGPQIANQAINTEQELLLAGGCSVFHVASDGTVKMKRYVSTYTTNAQGNQDGAWQDVMAQAVSTRIRYDWRTYFRSLYPSNKLAPDGSLAAQNDPTVCTPNRAKASWGARMMVYAKAGWVVDEVNQANAAAFTIDPSDPNRLNYRIPYTRIGNLIVDAGQIVMNVGAE